MPLVAGKHRKRDRKPFAQSSEAAFDRSVDAALNGRDEKAMEALLAFAEIKAVDAFVAERAALP